MDYKQKYEQALEYMRTVYPTLNGAAKEDVEHYFPELKESEDERVRKEIIEYFQQFENGELHGVNISDWIAWLEKQDPKKHEEELEKAYKTADEVQYRKGFEDGVASVKPVEWSEDGEMMINTIIYDLERHGGKEDSNYSAEINWLKSLKERYIWKPNEEQLSVLNEVINYAASDPSMHWNDYLYNILKQLKHQLLKLKGE